jgi:hypothetical protein
VPDGIDVHVWRTSTGAAIAYGWKEDAWFAMYWPGLCTYRFAANVPHITAFPERGAAPAVVYDIYRRSVLPMAMQALDREALHASAIQVDGRVIAFAAVSQTGKSTVAYGLSRRGYEQWADDGVVFELVGGQAMAVPLPFDVRLRPESSRMFGLDGSRFQQFSSMDADRCAERNPTALGAVCVLSRSAQSSTGSPVAIERLAPAQAFAAVLAHAHEFDPSNLDRRSRMLRTYLELLDAVPVYQVRFRPGAEYFPHVLDALVAGLGLGAAADDGLHGADAAQVLRPAPSAV